MSRLDELISELCPDGVEFLSLNILFSQFSGMGGVSAKWAEEGNCRFIDYMNAYKHLSIDVNDLPYATVKKLDQTTLMQGDILFTSASETPDECAISSVIEDKIQDGIFLDDHLFGLRIKAQYRENISPSYLKYVFRTDAFRTQMKKAVRGVTRFYVSKTDFMKLVIPVPPLPVQHEIVRMLDSFTELTAELNEELTARKKQYEYYKEQLLSSDNVNYYTIGELSTYRRGSFPQPYGNKEWYDGEGAMPFVQVADIGDDMRLVPNTKRKISVVAQPKSVFAPAGSIVISLQGSIGRIAITQYDAYIDRTVAIFQSISEKVVPKYFVYQLQRVFAIKEKTARGSTIKTITKEDFTSFVLPIPSIEKQQYIVSILDRFDNLCNDISNGLPAEITARQKQYEYYRDKLLSFQRKEHEEQ